MISLRMLLEHPNPKDPQDAEVATMLLNRPEEFATIAHDWAVKYAGAPRTGKIPEQYKAHSTKPAAAKESDPSRCVTG
jgi:ubiquitin-conjugating enzyme (huntingtin interacting protein 2)